MAVRIVLKRSSIPNKRPNADILDPGELALNTNAGTPGLFFEADNNQVIKVGPTAVGSSYPTLAPSLGETSYNPVTNTLSIGDVDLETASQVWREISGPYLGGTNGYVVFVAPEFPTASDSILNNGQSAPFATLNRAVIEIGKQSVVRANESDKYQNNRFTIFLQPGVTAVYNGPGVPIDIAGEEQGEVFDVNFDTNPEVTVDTLQKFNPTTGALLLPRGTSIQGFDLRKTILAPSYVPTYRVPGKNAGVNQSITSAIKWTGNSYISNCTFKDKISEVYISEFSQYQNSGSAVFTSLQSHGFGLNDVVDFQFAAGANRTPTGSGTAEVLSGKYYVKPLEEKTFMLSYIPISPTDANYIERNQLPVNDQGLAFICTATWAPYSHHRLRAVSNATLEELNEFYTKIQLAFPKYFNGQVDQGEVINPGETVYVAPVTTGVDTSISNQNDNGSPYAFNCTVRSSYGMCGIDNDAALVSGFKSVLATQVTIASIQNDPQVYEVYTTIFDEIDQVSKTQWYPLPVATWASLPPADRIGDPWLVPAAAQLAYLNTVPVINIRYAYQSLLSPDGKSYGLPDLNNDCRHFGFRVMNLGFFQIDTCWTIGPAVGFWSMGGSKMTTTGSSSNFGSIAVRTEGFSGIGSLGGAMPQDRGFVFAGIRMPQKLNPFSVTSFNVYSLGASVKSVVTGPDGVQILTLGSGFKPITLLPFSLAPDSALWIQNGKVSYRAFFVSDGKPTAVFLPTGDCELRLRAIDSSIPDATSVSASNWEPPFIKRFQDPRTISQQSYSLILQNTEPAHRDPVVGNILRIQQTSSNNNQALSVRPGVQFDPGPSGGWGRVFQVIYSQTSTDGDAPQFNETLLNRPIGSFYYTALSALDNSRPWLETYDKPHGAYVTFQNRNWYATCNDDWEGVYFATEADLREELKLKPSSYDSPYANTSCLENQYPVKSTFQGQFGGDQSAALYEDGSYFRGSTVIQSNYDFSDYYDQDNGTTDFGLLRHDIPTGIFSATTKEVAPTDKVIFFASLSQFESLGDPKKDFIILALQDANSPNKKEYVQVLAYNSDSSVSVLRGVYNTAQTGTWPVGSTGAFQATSQNVLPDDYDKDWAPSKYAMTRFLQVMGYSSRDIKSILIPKSPSSRNLYLSDISIQPQSGYATFTGPWGFEFNLPSTVNCTFHQFHTVGYFDYSRGLPSYLKSNINAKQYYDFLSTCNWGGFLTLFGQNESGQTIIEGELTQALTGRPYGSLSSDITNFPRIKVDNRDDGETTSYVRLVETGAGLVGGPITDVGSISLLPATDALLGGVFPGDGLSVSPVGQLSLDRNGVGTMNSVTAGTGLGAPATGDTITNRGTLSLLPPVGTTIGGVTEGLGVQISISGALGLRPPTLSNIGGVKAGSGVAISAEGSLSILPPSSDGTTIGAVKAGKGILIASDGTISVPGGPSGVVLLDQIVFNGAQVQFSLTSGSSPVNPAGNQYVLIAIGGVIQSTPQAYSISGSTITFTAAPPAGASFYGVVWG